MALGAQRWCSLILRSGATLTAIGLTLGLIGAAAASRYLQSMLFGVEPTDVATFVAVALGFSFVASIASYLPARRATVVDPVVALRQD